MKERNNFRSWRLLMLCCLAFVMLFQYAHGQTLPANFTRVQVATGLEQSQQLWPSHLITGYLFVRKVDNCA